MALTGCCCCSLRTGGMIIGWVGLCLAILSLAGALNMKSATEIYRPQMKDMEISDKDFGEVMDSIMTVLIASAVIDILMHLLLLLGIHKEKPMLMVAWLTTSMIKIIGLFIEFIIICYLVFTMGHNYVLLAIVGLFIGLYIYFWACVQALFREFRRIETARRETAPRQEELDNLQPTKENFYSPPPYKA